MEGPELGSEQKELLTIIVEACGNVSDDDQKEFLMMPSLEGTFLNHPGLPGGEVKVNRGVAEELHNLGLIVLSYDSVGVATLDVTTEGFECFGEMTAERDDPVQRVQDEMRRYLDAEFFQMTHPFAYEDWAQAERKLWAIGFQNELTAIAHFCQQAMKEFADDLIEIYRPPVYDQDKGQTAERIKAVLDHRFKEPTQLEKSFLNALLEYWRAVSDLIQHKEQGGAENKQITLEDARRIVFQTAVVMFEISRSLEPQKAQ